MGKFGGVGSSTVLTDLQVDGTTVTVDATNNRLGLGTAAPGTQVQVEGSAPYITLKNDTAENTDGGCESRIIFEDHANVTLAQIQGSHDGSSDDTKGDLIFSTHDGSSLDEALRIDSAQLATFAAAATVTTNLTVGGDIILDDGGSLKEAGGTAAITFDGSGNVTKLSLAAAAVAIADDHIVILDGGATGAPKAESIQDLLTAIAGSGISVSGNQLVADGGGTADAVAADNISQGDSQVDIKTNSGTINIGHADNDEAINIGSTGTGAIQIGHSTTTSVGVATTALTVASDTTTFTSANADDPLVQLKNTTNDASGARLQFVKDKGAAGADGDDIGVIEFVGDDAAQTQTTFAKIVAEVSEADDSDEAGKLSFFVAESDGTTTALAAGLVLEGEHATNGEVDVTIGAGAASITTIVGTSQFNAAATFGVDDTGVDVRIFSATASEGVLYDASEDELALLLTTKLKFHDVGGGEEIFASADGHLEINAGTTLDITAPTVDINASTALNIDGSLTVVATDAQTTNGIIGQFQAGDGAGAEVNRISINCSTSNQDTGISFMDNGATKWTLGNDGSTDDFHIRVGYGLYGVTDELVLNSAGKMTLLDDTDSSATTGGAIRLVSNDGAVMGDNHRLGVIEFAGAEDTSNTISIGARIQAICRAAWDGSNNDADLEFYTTDGTTESLVLTLDADKLATFSGPALFSGNATFGADDTGVDVRIFSATASEGVLYDASEDELALLLTTKLKFHDVGGGEEIFASANGHLEVNAGTTLDMTAPTVDINASTAVTIDGPAVTVADSAAGKPVLTLKTTHTTKTSSGELQFLKDAADTEDGEVLGQITFYGEDEGNNNTQFAGIVASISESAETDEAGTLELQVAESDGTNTAITTGLKLEGEHATDGQVDVTIGAGVGSTTTIVGDAHLNHDAAQLKFGVDSDVSIAHLHNVGLQVSCNSANAPHLVLKGTSNDANGPILTFTKDKGAAGADSDDIGTIQFIGDDAAQTQTTFAKIVAEVSEADDTDEAGKLSLFVAESDGTTTALTAGLVLEGEHATDGQVDVTIGAGAASTTAIVGTSMFGGNATFGADDTGVDVRIFSATASEGVLYDASEDELALLLTTKLKFHDVGGGEEIFASANGHLEVNAGTTLDMTAPTVDINASTAVTIDTDTLTVSSANSTDPLVIIKNTTNDANGARLQFVKDKGAAGADGDDIGVIEFIGDDAAQTQTTFAKIVAEVSEADNTDEAGKLSFFVAESDGTDTALTAGLILEGEHATDGQVDVTIGAGAASTTTIAGTLDLGDRNITNVGDISLDSVSSDGSLVTINAPCEVANGSSGGATALILDNDDTDQIAFAIEAANIDADVIDITADAVTTANVIDITADALTSGAALKIVSDCSSTTVRSLAHIHQDHASATHAACLRLTQDGAGPALQAEGPVVTFANSTQDNDTNGHTITAAQLIDGTFFAINRGSGKTDTTATAAQIVAAIPNAAVGTMFMFRYINLSGNAVTLAGDTGVTMMNGGAASYSIAIGTGRVFAFSLGNVGDGSESVSIIPMSVGFSLNS